MRSAMSTSSGAPIVRCSARSTRNAPNSRPPQIRCADSHCADASSKPTSRRCRIVRRQHAGDRRARQRRDRGPEDQSGDEALIVRRHQLELIEQLQQHEHRERRGERPAQEHRERGERHAVTRADARDERTAPPPADEAERERQQPGERQRGRRDPRRAALVARVARSSRRRTWRGVRLPPARPTPRRARNTDRAPSASGGTWSPRRRRGAGPTAWRQAAWRAPAGAAPA